MIVPDHWAEARATVCVKGRNTTLRRFGWSDASAADAQAQAELRVAEAAQRAARGENVPRRELKLTYNGAQGLPIREEVLARHGTAVITRNTYGARCLNVPDLLIADVDFSTRPPAVQRAGLQLLLVCVSLGVLFSLGVGVIGVIAAIGDSLHNPAGSVMCSGFFELKKSEPLVYTYTYDEMKLVVKGEFILTDQDTGETTHAKEGDVLFFPKGTTVKFETPEYGLGFFVE